MTGPTAASWFHSSAHDERKMKKLCRLLKEDLDAVTKTKADHEKIEYACLPDARAAVSRIPKGKFHRLSAQIQEIPKYGRGRPRADGTQTVARMAYSLRLNIEGNKEAIAKPKRKQDVSCSSRMRRLKEKRVSAPKSFSPSTRTRIRSKKTSGFSRTMPSSMRCFSRPLHDWKPWV